MSENDINLAAMWIPVMAETSHIKEQLKKAGEEAKPYFLEGLGMSELGGKMGTGLLDGLKHSELTGGLTTILSGGFAGVVAAFTEGGLNLVNAAFEKTIDLAKETAKAVLEIGESWHEVGRQLELSTTASGAALEELNRSAENVVRSGLDTSMKGLGSTMGVLSQRIGLTGAPLENLTKDLLRVQDRFGQFKTGDFAAILKEFDVGPADAAKTLEQLVNASRATSVSLPELIAGAKTTGSVFHQLGLDAGEAGALVAQLTAAGINTAPVLKALQASAKKLPPGESLADEIKGIIVQLDKAKAAGDVPTEQRLAAKLFGAKWADGLDAIQKGLLDTGTLIATFSNDGGQSLDQLLDHTATLGNKWTELQNDASEALKPLGETAIAILEGPLEKFKGWFEQNHDQIVGKIKDFGDKFIDALPEIRDFVADAIDLLGPFANALKELGTAVAGTVEPLIEGWALLTGNDKLLKDTQQMGEEWNKIEKLDLSKVFSEASDAVKNMSIDTDGLKRNLQDAADAATQLGNTPALMGPQAFVGPTAVSGPPVSTGSNGQSYNIAPQSLSIPMPPSAAPGGSLSPTPGDSALVAALKANGSFSPEQIRLIQGFSKVEGLNPAGNPTLGFNDAQLGGDSSLQGHVNALAKQFKDRASVAGAFPQGGSDLQQAQWIAKVVGQPLSGINPPDTGDYVNRIVGDLKGASPANAAPATAVPNITPSGNGLNLSTIPVAAQKYANDCIDASARIILSHSGVNMTEEQLESVITPGGSIDSQAAGLNKLDPQGKFVAMQGSGGSQQAMFNAIKASIDNGTGSVLNVAPGSSLAGHTFAPGHFIAATGYNPDGTINVSDTAGGRKYSVSQQDAFQATRGRGIVAGTGMGPTDIPSIIPGSAGKGFLGLGGPKLDNPPQPGGSGPTNPLDFGNAFSGAPQAPPPPSPVYNSSNFAGAPPAPTPPSVYKQWYPPAGPSNGNFYKDWYAPGADAGKPSAFDNASAPGDPGASVSMPAPNMPMPAMTGNYAIDSRNLQLVQAQMAIVTKQQTIDDELQKITDMQNDPTTDPKKLEAAQQKLSADQFGLSVDKEKLALDQEKPLGKSGNSSMESNAQQFGSGFLKGIFSDLGFGNVLGGKSPLDWGITKLLGGLAGWGIGEANAFADNTMAGQGSGMGGPLGGGSPVGGGIFAGLMQAATGLKIPNAGGVPLAPSGVATSAVDPNSTTHGMANGAQPGPNVYDNRIMVQGNTMVDPNQLVPPMQEQMNANSASRASTGSLPIAPGPGGG